MAQNLVILHRQQWPKWSLGVFFFAEKDTLSFVTSKCMKYLMKMCRKFVRNRQFPTEFSKKLCTFTAFYDWKQNGKWCWNKNSSNFVKFWHFGSFLRFQAQFKNWDSGLFLFESHNFNIAVTLMQPIHKLQVRKFFKLNPRRNC